MDWPVVVLGGAVLDLHARPVAGYPLHAGGTVPGTVRQVAGGVARNIAECMARIGSQRPLLVSIVGNDGAADALRASLHAADLESHALMAKPDVATATCLTLVDADGEVAGAVADVAGMDCLRPEDVRLQASHIQRAPVIMLDANLPADCLQEAATLAQAAQVPVWFEPTSPPKSVRAVPMLPSMTFVSPNSNELIAMANGLRAAEGLPHLPDQPQHDMPQSGISSSSSSSSHASHARQKLDSLQQYIRTLLEAGVQHVVLTLGAEGAAWCCFSSCLNPFSLLAAASSSQCSGALVRGQDSRKRSPANQDMVVLHIPALPAQIRSLIGAGDSLVAGCMDALLRGLQPGQALAYGVAAAKHAAESSANVPTIRFPLHNWAQADHQLQLWQLRVGTVEVPPIKRMQSYWTEHTPTSTNVSGLVPNGRRPDRISTKPAIMDSPEMSTPPKPEEHCSAAEAQAVNERVLKQFMEACGGHWEPGWRIGRRRRASSRNHDMSFKSPQGWQAKSLKDLGRKLGLDPQLVAEAGKSCKNLWRASLPPITGPSGSKPRRMERTRPTAASPVARKRGRTMTSSPDDFRASAQPQDVLMSVSCKRKHGIFNRNKKQILCRCHECLSSEDAACIFAGSAFVDHAGGNAARRWTQEVFVTELDSGPCYLTVAAQLQSLFRSAKRDQQPQCNDDDDDKQAHERPGHCGLQALVNDAEVAPACEPAAPDLNTGCQASAHASRTNSQELPAALPTCASQRPGGAQPSINATLPAYNVVPSQYKRRQQSFSKQAQETKPSSSSETCNDDDREHQLSALEMGAREQDAKIKAQAALIVEQAAEISWLNQAPARARCLLEARNKRIEELEGINESLLDEIERMKHAR
ncbi:hypothetical protein WJX74_010586 [Apatococcus lobatus]|uniref:Carbohydrate kinase PfkB domain-containing protein n=1 Tax=Apatococcus lobatus TaxID=904363 RepID=A0AAW1QIW1_9CHLO